MLWLTLGLLALLQDDTCPLREGMVLTYEVQERSGESAAQTRDLPCSIRAPQTQDGREWFEVSNFMFYDTAFLRNGEDGFEFRAPEYGSHSLLLFKKGAKAGDAWKSELTDKESVQFRVEAEETIEVPAGSYRTWRVSFVISAKQRKPVPNIAVGNLWIAPGTGVVRGTIDRNPDCDGGHARSFSLKKIEK